MGLMDRFKGRPQATRERPEGIRVADGAASAGSVLSAVTGRLVAMRDIPDPVFASGALGVCAGVWPEEDVVFAPVSGVVTAAMPHAMVIATDDGLELLVHAGIDTVELRGDGFELYRGRGDRVRAGDALMAFSRAKVAKAGYQDIVICVVANSDRYEDVTVEAPRQVRAGEKIIGVGARTDVAPEEEPPGATLPSA